jgi:hypothetical protein
MEKKPSIDLGILAPIALGVLSIAGILAIFYGGLTDTRPTGEVVSTETPYRYIYLGTEPGLSTLTLEPTETPTSIELPTLTNTPDFIVTPLSTSTPIPSNVISATSNPTTNVVLPTQTSSRTPVPTATETLQAVLGKFDDTYYEILYDGDWTTQTNVTGAYQNTLHVSLTAENYVVFAFVGQQVIISYQAGPSLGEILITIDGVDYPTVSQSNGTTISVNWPSPELVMGPHDILITHLSGGSINLDSITVPDLSTATPTPNL